MVQCQHLVEAVKLLKMHVINHHWAQSKHHRVVIWEAMVKYVGREKTHKDPSAANILMISLVDTTKILIKFL